MYAPEFGTLTNDSEYNSLKKVATSRSNPDPLVLLFDGMLVLMCSDQQRKKSCYISRSRVGRKPALFYNPQHTTNPTD